MISTRNKIITVRLSESEVAALDNIVAELNLTRSDIIRLAINKIIKSQ